MYIALPRFLADHRNCQLIQLRRKLPQKEHVGHTRLCKPDRP